VSNDDAEYSTSGIQTSNHLAGRYLHYHGLKSDMHEE
jgi:hypothetical protein